MNANKPVLSEQTIKQLLKFQLNELTEHEIYLRIAQHVKAPADRDVLLRIAREEETHGKLWQSYTGKKVRLPRLKIWWYSLLSRVLGYTFALKIMEKGEDNASSAYETVAKEVPEARQIGEEEKRHEEALIAMLDEERLQYVGSMVLGLNDALVELTGTLAGLSFALQNTRLIALSGLITGISATLSMASSEYLSARSEGEPNALKSSIYTGVMYLVAVVLLVLPYLVFPAQSFVAALITMLVIVVAIIFGFTYYISVAKDLPFKKRFTEMACISLSVAALSFVVGILVKEFLGIDI
ncbi:MAG: VIT1/CCC1 transporter family protein [Angelakisella sp.]|nr:VIT1/CCC1 transporter family protein [Angelakisella sp.]